MNVQDHCFRVRTSRNRGGAAGVTSPRATINLRMLRDLSSAGSIGSREAQCWRWIFTSPALDRTRGDESAWGIGRIPFSAPIWNNRLNSSSISSACLACRKIYVFNWSPCPSYSYAFCYVGRSINQRLAGKLMATARLNDRPLVWKNL